MAAVALALAGSAHAEPDAGVFTLAARPSELVDAATAASYASILDPQQTIEWDVYAPADADAPVGVVVWISPRDDGLPPDDWRPVLDAHKLLWISARHSGNDAPVARRVLYALLALRELARETEIDWANVYVAGFSGGGHSASNAAALFPLVFKGAIYMCGADYRPRDPALIAQMRANRFVFLTGAADPNNEETRSTFDYYRAAGVPETQLSLMEIPNLGHRMPRARDFDRALRFLEADR
ncbi:MAG TPA: hypothetical protein VG841_03880 [Caulobacterales bacterium]|nr:hypothetical protein [Caulobacterales bacterium]